MLYNGYHIWGMHLVWWFAWFMLLIWIFGTPYDVPGQRMKRDTPLYILKKRFALGQLTKEEYYEQRAILEKE